ncbi:hypothetical protein VTO42DRAFT_9018 [Malbranchea cinnamomea]
MSPAAPQNRCLLKLNAQDMNGLNSCEKTIYARSADRDILAVLLWLLRKTTKYNTQRMNKRKWTGKSTELQLSKNLKNVCEVEKNKKELGRGECF